MVWTERMLATLETGIEGGKWFRLIDKVWSPKNLARSLEKVVAKGGSAGVDHQSAGQIKVRKDQTIAKLEQELRANQYQPQAVKRVWIPKAGSKEKRPLGVPTLRDRIVQGALLHVIEPIFERDFAPQSYGFRPGKGCKDALRRVEELLKSGGRGVRHLASLPLSSIIRCGRGATRPTGAFGWIPGSGGGAQSIESLSVFPEPYRKSRRRVRLLLCAIRGPKRKRYRLTKILAPANDRRSESPSEIHLFARRF
jgi:hypothetical protein